MRILLDTHVLLWAATDPKRLGDDAKATLEDGANAIAVSIVSAWEIAIKQSLGKLELPKPADVWLPTVLRRSGFEIAELSLEAALGVGGLPWHHRDPFDRLLVAHAVNAGYSIMTRDPAFAAYGVHVIAA